VLQTVWSFRGLKPGDKRPTEIHCHHSRFSEGNATSNYTGGASNYTAAESTEQGAARRLLRGWVV
jgi:hypothetical protein